jgi:peptidoglycan/LPS O-acetylase OafA/YrhL
MPVATLTIAGVDVKGERGYQPALDGVRAVAVIGVLLYHAGVGGLPGGFLGVDAFFVLSGFLITSLLLTEYAAHGRIRLGAFWLRRARRLLPALLLVLVVTVLCYRTVLAGEDLTLLRGDALAALLYVANWRMIYRGDDYFALTATPSPLQHTWSLGIEEQFYLLWPLLLIGLFVLLPQRARWRALVLGCLAGAGISAVLAAVTFTPADVNRVYFGTDTRAEALLVGCALAAVLARPRTGTPSWVPDVVGAAGLAGLLGLAWLWTHADGGDAWLYRGGLAFAALAAAAVIAHATLSPQAPLSALLALPALVWVGRISYGLYLWHWPLYGLITRDRTGLYGFSLLSVRLAVTLAVAAVSYALIEQPIRTGRWRWHALGSIRSAAVRRGGRSLGIWPQPTRVRAGLATGTAMVLTASFIVAGTVPPRTQAQPAAVVVPDEPLPVRPPPMQRAGRKLGPLPRITFFGDSVSWTLGTYLPEQPGLWVSVRSVQGCGIARLPDIIQLGEGHTNYPGCPTWDARWRYGVDTDDPDVAVILLDRWELMDRKLDGVYQHVGEPEFDAYLTMELELAVGIAGSHGAQVVLLTAPYTRRAERPNGDLYDEDQPERVDAWNRILRTVAQLHPTQVTVLDLNKRVCPQGEFTWTIGRLRIRSDGLHFTPDGVRLWIAPWLMPQLARIATGSIYATARGD